MKLFPLLMMMIAPFGTWKSPISSDTVASGGVRFYEMQADQEFLYWLELSPQNKGRVSLVRYDGKETPLLQEVSVRTRVHEYGGGAFFAQKGELLYSNDADSQLYSLEGTKKTDAKGWRFADGCGSIWVGERHDGQVENCLVSIQGDTLKIIASGHDFYSCPRLSPDGKQLAFITWDFPYMQWDSSTLWLAEMGEDDELHHIRANAGGANSSVCAVQWSEEGQLHFVWDQTGFWNLYKLDGQEPVNLCEREAEFAPAPWVFGMPSYVFLEDGSIICAYTVEGIDHLGKIDPLSHTLEDLGLSFTSIQNLVSLKGKVYFFGASPTSPSSIVCYDPKTKETKTIKQSFQIPFSKEEISVGEAITFPTKEGQFGHAFYYPPKNPNFQAPEGELPPLLVRVHGGPTARSYHALSFTTQYWTSRGFAFVDINYGGSTGFGRSYMKRLEGNWGIVDLDDTLSAVQYLVDKGLVDPNRLLIHGGSAGGYTTLAALAFHNLFAGGTSLYGVSDLEMLCVDTHKFESKYNDILVAPYPEEIETIRARSPITHVDKITTPILLLQGDEDTIVPPNQSFAIFEALKKKKIPTGILLFEGEGHGFRKKENVQKALDAQLYFYAYILGLNLPEPFAEPPVEIVYPTQ